MKENKKSAFKKTEEILRNYNKLKIAVENNSDDTEKTQKLLNIIDAALKSIENDKYYDVIEMIYFENKTREDIAEMYDCEVKTVTRNKNRLVNQLKIVIFSDDVIKELFL